MAPSGSDYAFLVNSGSEAVDTALKMALAYHRLCGEASRTRFIGREKVITALVLAVFQWVECLLIEKCSALCFRVLTICRTHMI